MRSAARLSTAVVTLSAALVSLGTASTAHAQGYTMGGDARAFGMGGAGIALTAPRGSGARSNPASLAFERNEVLPTFPSFGIRATGPAKSDAASTYLLGGAKEQDALSVAAKYGTGRSDLGLNGVTALRVGKIEVGANAVAIAHVLPNASFQTWAASQAGKTRIDPLTLASDGRADIWSAGYYTLPSVAAGFTIPTSKSKKSDHVYGAGLRVKQMTGIFSHRVIERNVNTLSNGVQQVSLSANPAADMNGKDTISKTGIGVDLGFMMRPRKGYGFSAAFVVANALSPNFKFTGIDADGTRRDFNLLPTSISTGIGYETKSGFTFAADLVDIGGKKAVAGSLNSGIGSMGQQFRVGAEQRLFKTIAIRGGFSSAGGTTYGVGLMGVDVAFGKKVPLEVVKTINF